MPNLAFAMDAASLSQDYILDIDSLTGCYEVLALSAKKLRRKTATEAYEPALLWEASHRVLPEHSQKFYETFNVCHLLTAFARGSGSVEMDFQWRLGERIFWKKRIAFPYSAGAGRLHILIYVRDMTEAQIQELQRQEDATNYLLAVQSMYTEIYHIDIESGNFSSIYLDEAQAAVKTPPRDVEEFFAQRAELVAPEYVDNFVAAYALESLRRCARQGKPVELEYRRRKQDDPTYRWIAATIMPGAHQKTVLLFLRDITRIREAQDNFYTALKNNYGDIFTINAAKDNMSLIAGNTEISRNVPLPTHSFKQNMTYVAEHCAHPDDREAFLAFYNAENLLQGIKGHKKLTHEHRLKHKEDYRWYDALVLPLPGASPDEMLVLCQDIHQRKQIESAGRRLEQRYNEVFRQSCDYLLEIDLSSGNYTLTNFRPGEISLPTKGHITLLFDAIRDRVHPEDRKQFLEERDLQKLREAHAANVSLPGMAYRLQHGEKTLWMESRTFFAEGESGPCACILIRDFTEQKDIEDARNAENHRLNVALRDTYTEIYELDTLKDTSRLLFSNSTVLTSTDFGFNATPVENWHIVQSAIHPADRDHLWDVVNGKALRAAFAAGQNEVSVEFRHQDKNGGYIWLAGMAMPMREVHPTGSKALFFLKDISARKQKEEQQRVLEQYSLALRNIYDFFYEVNLSCSSYRTIYHSSDKFIPPASEGSMETLLNTEAPRIVHPEDMAALRHFFSPEAIRADFATGAKHRMGEFRTLHVNGQFQWASFTMFPQPDCEGSQETYIFFGLNIHAYKIAEEMARRTRRLEQQRIADERYKIVVQQTDTMIFEWKSTDGSRYVSPKLLQRFSGNYDQRSILSIWEEDNVVHPEDMAEFHTFVLEQERRAHGETTVRLLQRQGNFVWCRVCITSLMTEEGKIYHRIGTLNDVDASTRAAHALRERAERDPLTGLYNMQTFYAKAVEAIHKFPDRHYAIIRMDIDDFKLVNDLYGMAEGDRLLKVFAKTLQNLMRTSSVCGRISGDVFCACVDLNDKGVERLVVRMTEMLSHYPLPGSVRPSFGICRVESVNTPINVLCDWANLALKTIKGHALRNHAFYEGRLRESFLKEKRIRSEMHQALSRGQFELYLQPKVHMPTRAIVGAEALVRWHHPTRGVIAPDDFVPIFEKNGFILQLDEHIWEKTCALLQRWRGQDTMEMPISINVSRLHILDTRLSAKLAELLRKYDIPASLLELELTESIFLDNKAQARNVLNTLRDMGFRFALDDFGAGFSSLNMLKSLPVESLKIDKGFFDEVVGTDKGKIIIRHVIALAKDMSMTVIAEGVETEEQADFLCENGCVLAQGYYYAPPLRITDFENMAFGEKKRS